MRNKNKLLLLILLMSSFTVCAQRYVIPDSLINNNLLKLELKSESNSLGFRVENMTPDTLELRSSFYIDDPTKMSYILIYYCQTERLDEDSSKCDYGYATQYLEEPPVLTFYDRLAVMPPNASLFFPLRISTYYGGNVFLKAQMMVLHKGTGYFVQKTSNSITF